MFRGIYSLHISTNFPTRIFGFISRFHSLTHFIMDDTWCNMRYWALAIYGYQNLCFNKFNWSKTQACYVQRNIWKKQAWLAICNIFALVQAQVDVYIGSDFLWWLLTPLIIWMRIKSGFVKEQDEGEPRS